MPPPATNDDLLDLVRKSGLVDADRLDAYLARLEAGSSDTLTDLADSLVREGLLTPFHTAHLLQGKCRGFQLGKYRVLQLIGAGGMGRVYLCEHLIMNRPAAVKVLPTEALRVDPTALPRLYREARAAASFDHPNIAHAYDVDQEGKLHFLVMEYVDGINLHDLVARHGTLALERVVDAIRQAAWGLEHAHAAGWVHRDIKPGNLLLDRHGVVKILDMGLARLFDGPDDRLTKRFDQNTLLGTADYLSPEQATGLGEVDIRSDIYSLGGTLFYLLTGEGPFEGGTVAQKILWHQFRQPRSIRTLRPDTPEELEAVLMKMLAKNPEERFQTPGEVAEALAGFAAGPFTPPESEMPQHCPRVALLLHRGAQEQSAAISYVRSGGPKTPASGGRRQPSVAVIELPETASPTPKTPLPRPQPSDREPAEETQRAPRTRPMAASRKPFPWIWPALAASGLVVVGGIGGVLWAMGVFEGSPGVPSSLGTGQLTSKPDTRTEPTLPPGVIAAREAVAHKNEKTTVQLRVDNVGGGKALAFLNSEKDYKRTTNFTVVLPPEVQDQLKESGISDLEAYFKGKTIHVTGTITLFEGRAQIRVTSSDQLEVVKH